MNKLTICIITYVIIGLFTTAYGQSYSIKHLGTEFEELDNYITDISQDRQGNIWIATESELSRFDGNEFTIYNSRNSALKNNALNTLLYDNENNLLWIGTKKGLYTMNLTTKRIEPFILPKEAMLDNIISLNFSADSCIWITNLYHSIIKYNPKDETTEILTQENVPGLYFSNSCAIDDHKGHLYVGHTHGGMSIIDLKNHTIKNFKHDPKNPKSLPADWVNCIYIDHYDNIWIGTKKGLSIYNPSKEEFTNFYHNSKNGNSILSNDIYDIKEINETELWIACEIGGISILDLRDLTFKGVNDITFRNISTSFQEQSLSSKNIRKIFQDTYKNIWVGNYGTGLDFISHNPKSFYTLPKQSEDGTLLANKPTGGIYMDGTNIWIGSENKLSLYNNHQLTKTFNLSEAPFGASNSQINAIIRNNEELLLGMSDAGIISFKPQTNQAKRLKLTQENEAAYHFYKDSQQKIWIGAESGLYSYRQGNVVKEDILSSQMNNLSVFGICEDKQGKLWIGTHGGGIFIFNSKNELEHHLTTRNGLCDNSIFHLFQDSNGRIWAATREGVVCIEAPSTPQHIINYGFENGLKETFTHAISEDEMGYIWISTTKGLSRMDPANKHISIYNHYDGLPNGNFFNGSVCKGVNGYLYYGSLNGICYFNPKHTMKEQSIAPVNIVECMTVDNRIEETYNQPLIPSAKKGISLPYNHNSFRITFSIPDYSQSSSAEYAYLIEGLSKKWTHTQGEKQVTFRNMPPGNYLFKVKARLHNQDWDDTHIATIKIKINPPIWLTWYAKVFYLCIFLGIIYFLIRIYNRHLNQKNSLVLIQEKAKNEQDLNQERLRFYTNITHELRTPLTLILGPLEDLINDPGLPPFYESRIKIIHGSALRLLNLINQILEFRKAETQNRKLSVRKGDLQALVTEIGLRFKELNRNEKVKFIIQAQDYKEHIFFDADIITTILNNLLSNAVKYTTQGEITLSLQQITENNCDYTKISVKDTGYGIDPNVLPHIFDRYYQAKSVYQVSGSGIGLALVKSLAALHEGSIHVESALGEGSTFTFRILTHNSYPSALHKEDKIESPAETITLSNKKESNGQNIILIIEDDVDIRQYISSSLDKDYKVLTAANGMEGLELTRQYIPDIIVSDIMMPIMDGLTFCREIKKDVRTCHIPVVLLTAKDSIQEKKEGYESGADSYITKPFSVKLLLSRIQNLQKRRERLAGLATQGTTTIDKEVKKDDHPNTTDTNTKLKISRLDQEFLNRFTQLVDENLTDKELNITFLTERMSMTTSTLYRKIKGLTGLSANEFIRKYRLQKSLKYMKDEGYNISETAYACGFSDSGYFRNCFKQEFGITPSEYLKQLHQS